MAEMGKMILQGMLAFFCQEGVFVEGTNYPNENTLIMYLSIPADSYLYHEENTKIQSAESFAKTIKEKYQSLMDIELRVKYKTYLITWTKELGKACYERNKLKILNLEFPELEV